MAEMINEMPKKRGGRAGRPCVYDWDKLLDGNTWMLSRGVDYQCLTSSFLVYFDKACRSRGLVPEYVVVDPNTICIKAHQKK